MFGRRLPNYRVLYKRLSIELIDLRANRCQFKSLYPRPPRSADQWPLLTTCCGAFLLFFGGKSLLKLHREVMEIIFPVCFFVSWNRHQSFYWCPAPFDFHNNCCSIPAFAAHPGLRWVLWNRPSVFSPAGGNLSTNTDQKKTQRQLEPRSETNTRQRRVSALPARRCGTNLASSSDRGLLRLSHRLHGGQRQD